MGAAILTGLGPPKTAGLRLGAWAEARASPPVRLPGAGFYRSLGNLSLSIGTSWAWKGPREDARYDASSRVSCGGRTRDQEGKRLGGMAKGRYSEILSEIFESFEFAAASYSLAELAFMVL